MPRVSEQNSVLIASPTEKAAVYIENILPPDRFGPVDVVTRSDAARRALVETPRDILIVNAPLPDEFGYDLAREAVNVNLCGVLMLVRGEAYEEAAGRTEGAGVLVISKPFSKQLFDQALSLLCATNRRLYAVRAQADTLKSRMDEIKLVNRAKLVLIEKLGMSEQDAHRFIEKSAMDRAVKRRDIARGIIKTYEN